MVEKPIFGNWNSIDILNSLDNYILFTMKEPWQIIELKIENKPIILDFNFNMEFKHLNSLFNERKEKLDQDIAIVGVGGGTSCDTAKFFAWKLKEQLKKDIGLYLIPSIISVDAFLCSSIAVRIDNKVKYIGESKPKEIIIDFELIRKAPLYLNRAGISDTLSIASALGDWKLAKDENNENFNQEVFNKAKKIAKTLMKARNDIQQVNETGIKAMVNGFYDEVKLCEQWGNARPEEASEHFLAYCLESLTHRHYIHGNLIGMNILISIFLQQDYAEFDFDEVHQFLNDIQLNWTASEQNISHEDLRNCLKIIKYFVVKENLFYSIFNSPKLEIDNKLIQQVLDLTERK
ncbi:MAG: iron-containing alcohol dehydrogenase [Candidatus Heimdallarchaeota archaeon]